jgi:rubrerythrin
MAPQTAKTTHTANAQYNLVSVLYHTLESASIYDTYIKDAEKENDKELAQFFHQLQEDDVKRADQAKQLLAQRLR